MTLRLRHACPRRPRAVPLCVTSPLCTRFVMSRTSPRLAASGGRPDYRAANTRGFEDLSVVVEEEAALQSPTSPNEVEEEVVPLDELRERSAGDGGGVAGREEHVGGRSGGQDCVQSQGSDVDDNADTRDINLAANTGLLLDPNEGAPVGGRGGRSRSGLGGFGSSRGGGGRGGGGGGGRDDRGGHRMRLNFSEIRALPLSAQGGSWDDGGGDGFNSVSTPSGSARPGSQSSASSSTSSRPESRARRSGSQLSIGTLGDKPEVTINNVLGLGSLGDNVLEDIRGAGPMLKGDQNMGQAKWAKKLLKELVLLDAFSKPPAPKVVVRFYKMITARGVRKAAEAKLTRELSRGGKDKANGHKHRRRTRDEIMLHKIIDINGAHEFAEGQRDRRKTKDADMKKASQGIDGLAAQHARRGSGAGGDVLDLTGGEGGGGHQDVDDGAGAAAARAARPARSGGGRPPAQRSDDGLSGGDGLRGGSGSGRSRKKRSRTSGGGGVGGLDFGALTTSMSSAVADQTEGRAHKRKMQDKKMGMQDKKMGMKLARSALELKKQTVQDCIATLQQVKDANMSPEVIAAAQAALLKALAS